MPVPPPWFLRVIPGIGIALTAAYVGYKLLEHLQEEEKLRKKSDSISSFAIRVNQNESEGQFDDEELEMALRMSLLEHSDAMAADMAMEAKEEEEEEEEEEERALSRDGFCDRHEVCRWLGLSTETALDEIPEERLPLCLEVLLYLPIQVRLDFATAVFGTKLQTDQQVQQFLRLVQSMEDEDEEQEARNEDDASELSEQDNSYDYGENLEALESEESENEFIDTVSTVENTGTTASTSESLFRLNSRPKRINGRELFVNLLMQMEAVEQNVAVLLQAVELCPQENRSILLKKLCENGDSEEFWRVLYQFHCRRRRQGGRMKSEDSQAGDIIHSDNNHTEETANEQPLLAANDDGPVGEEEDEFDVAAIEAFVGIMLTVEDEGDRTSKSSQGRTTGILRGLYLCDVSQQLRPLLFKMQSMSPKHLNAAASCFVRFDDMAVKKFIQTLLA